MPSNFVPSEQKKETEFCLKKLMDYHNKLSLGIKKYNNTLKI
jgi:hypothetical protein